MNYPISSRMTSSTEPNKSITFVGYRFHPTDDELVGHFLKHKMLGHDDKELPISEIKVCDFEPWDLPAIVNNNSEDQVWYFFCPRDYKYLRSRRSNRTTKSGYWKPTGKPRKVKAKRTKEEIGTKRSLVFYIKDQPKPRRTKWIIHEYECIHSSTLATQGNFLLCKLKSKPEEMINKGRSDLTTSTPNLQNQKSNEMTSFSSPDEHEQSICWALELGNDNQMEMTAMSTYEHGEQNFLLETTTDSTSNEDESCNFLDSQIKALNPTKITDMSTYETMDFERQNPHEILDISEDYEATPSEKTDMSESSFATDSENNAGEGTIIEVVDLLEALYRGVEASLELEENLNAALFPPTSTDESLLYPTTLNGCFSAGIAGLCQ